ncbi:MAG: hypothetical protein QXJ06_05560 [Candidatus Aenigmatarchaeota archaeon]
MTKMSFVIRAEEEAGIKTDALVKEVQRQISQISPQKNGDPITGKGVTKSGEGD